MRNYIKIVEAANNATAAGTMTWIEQR
jgi:hypothetical protein